MGETKYKKLSEISERYAVPISWLYERSRRDELPSMLRLGRHVRIDPEVFEAAVRNGVLSNQ